MKEEKFNYCIYKVENLVNGQVYIGATSKSIDERKKDHFQRVDKTYSCNFHKAIRTFGLDAFSWEQIDTANNNDELAKKEKQYVLKYNSKKDGYNSDCGGGIKKTIYQYSINDGCLISKFNSLNDAGNAINVSKQDISRACLSVNNRLEGYFWSYEFKEPFKPNIDRRRKKVIQFTLEGEFLSEYDSIVDASKKSGTSKSSIAKVCRGERKSAGGFKWNYL